MPLAKHSRSLEALYAPPDQVGVISAQFAFGKGSLRGDNEELRRCNDSSRTEYIPLWVYNDSLRMRNRSLSRHNDSFSLDNGSLQARNEALRACNGLLWPRNGCKSWL
jgi:hypothetical protein